MVFFATWRRRQLLISARIWAVLVFTGVVSVSSFAIARAEEASVPNELIVGFKRGVAPHQAESIYVPLGAARLREIQQLNVHKIQVPAHALEAVQRALSHRPEVEFVERNVLMAPEMTVNDPYISTSWHHTKINNIAAWDIAQGSGVVIAVIDSGVDSTHPDLVYSMVAGYNTYNENTDARDVTGHGTMAAGIAAATGNNGVGVAGGAWRARIMPIRASDTSGMFSAYDTSEAITWAVDHGARVISMSLGGSALIRSASVTAAAQYATGKGAVVVAAAGNCGCYDSTPDSPYIIHVSATTSDDVLASFSTYGDFVDVAAPTIIPTTARGGSYVQMGGTSASAPVVSGIVALMLAANPGLKAADITRLLKANADDLGTGGWDIRYGAGRVNAYRAVAAAKGTVVTTTSDTTSPAVSITSPSAGSTVKGTVTIAASASDNVGVSRVDFYVDGQFTGSDSTASFGVAWDTTRVSDGTHTLVAKAYDAAGNQGASSSLSVSVSNTTTSTSTTVTDTTAPTTNVDTVWGNNRRTKLTVSASDNIGVIKVELYIDGVLRGTSSSAPVTFTLDSRGLASGTHTAVSKAYDAAHNVGTSRSVMFTK